MFVLVQKRNEELANASGEQAESGSIVANKVSSGSKGSGTTTHQFADSNSASIIYTDEFDTSVAALNIVCPLSLLSRVQEQ